MVDQPTVKVSGGLVKVVRSYRRIKKKVAMNAWPLDRLTCKSIEVLTYGQQNYCQNFRKIGKGSQKLSSSRPLSFGPTDLQNNREVNLWPTNLLSKFRKDR